MANISLAKYDNGELRLEARDLQHTQYVAISHIWGKAEYCDLPSFPLRKVQASSYKVDFLLRQLPGLVGDGWFWMDIICVDQQDADARIAVVDHIPELFRKAEKTIVIKDGDGLKACCGNAIGTLQESHDWDQKLIDHLHQNHIGELIPDSWLERLWPLQEAILSNTLQFVSCDERNTFEFRFYGERMSYRRSKDDL
jgi:hypothetical protein